VSGPGSEAATGSYVWLTPERLIEVTIGLWDRDVPPGQRPPALAADIVQALHDDGWRFTRERLCTCHEDPPRGGGHWADCPIATGRLRDDTGTACLAVFLFACIAGALLWLAVLAGGQQAMCAIHDDALRYCPGYEEQR
jgi:hypothetical protein